MPRPRGEDPGPSEATPLAAARGGQPGEDVLARIRLAIDNWTAEPAAQRTGEPLKQRVAHEIAPYLGAQASRRIVTGVADSCEDLLSTVEPVLALFLGGRAAARLVDHLVEAVLVRS